MAKRATPVPLLGQHLKMLRQTHNLTLRDVEKATAGTVSNAYLSQIERGYIRCPNPHILAALAVTYGTDYADLMMRAGYAPPRARKLAFPRKLVSRFADYELTEEEELELIQFLSFLRSKKSK